MGPFKNIINEYYAKDISKKIKFTLRSKAERGEARKTTTPLYGYMYNEAGERVPDPETAPIVKKIFDYYLEYESLSTVERKLREEQIYCPGYYLYYKYNYNSPKYLDCKEEQKYEWRDTFIRTIIKNPEYLGHYITQKTYKNNFKVKKKQMNETPFVFENKFEPLISQETFDKAQRTRMVNTKIKTSIEENTYKKICYCGNCGKPLSFMRRRDRTKDASKYRYVCRNKDCGNKSYINKVVLDNLLRQEISSLIAYILKHKKKFIEYALNLNAGNTIESNTFALKERSRLIDMKTNLEKQLSRAKDLYIMKDLDLEEYTEYKTEIYKKIDSINKQISSIKIETEPSRDYEKEAKELLSILKELSELDALDEKVIEALIEKIVVRTEKTPTGYATGASIEIYYPKVNDIIGGFIHDTNSKK